MNANRGRLALCLASTTTLVSSACGEPLKRAELLEETRVLGARVEVEGDPERASPAPGERATVRWLVASPEEERPPLGWAFAACAAAPVQNGLPLCAAAPFGRYASSEQDGADPSFVIQLPAEERLAHVEWVVITGAICVDGTPLVDPAATFGQPACSPGSDRLLVNMYVLVQRGVATNRNPSLSAAEIEIDGEPWAEQAVGCADPQAPSIVAASRHEISVTVADHDREMLPANGELEPVREALQLSTVSTGGALDRPLSVVEANASERRMDVPWSAPADAGSAGQSVRFLLVLRDLRGGVDWTTRALCVR